MQKNAPLASEERIPLLTLKNDNTRVKDELIKNNDKCEQYIENQIDKKVTNETRNGFAIARGIISIGAKYTFYLPTCVFFAWYSQKNIDDDCKKMIQIFENAFTPLRFQTLNSYVKSFKKAIDYLDSRGKEIALEADERNEQEFE